MHDSQVTLSGWGCPYWKRGTQGTSLRLSEPMKAKHPTHRLAPVIRRRRGDHAASGEAAHTGGGPCGVGGSCCSPSQNGLASGE